MSGKDEPLAAGHASVPYDLVLARGPIAPDHALERIYLTGAVLDRLPPAAAVALLQRCRRALAPGGCLRVAVDDLDQVLERVQSPEAWQQSGLPQDGFDWGASRFHLLNHAFSQRAWFYNETELRRFANMVGFRRGRRVAAATPEPFQVESLRPGPLVMEFEAPVRQHEDWPTVDILIPLYRPDHLRAALESALEQTWEPITIVICDDGPGDEASAIVQSFRSHRRFDRLRYFQNHPPRGNTARNALTCLERSRGAYVKFLFDDDVLEPRCVEKMATCLRDHPDVTLVTSHRQLIDVRGHALPELKATQRPVAQDSRIGGAWLIDQMLRAQINFIGEPSTVLFRRADIEELLPDFWALGGINFMGNADVTIWLSLLAQGDGIYLTESLSRFRQHPEQTSNDPVIHEVCRTAWHRAASGAAFFGLYDPAVPPPLEATPFESSPWWSPQVRTLAQAARRALDDRDVTGALSHVQQALAAEPGDGRLDLLRARCLVARGDGSAALGILLDVARRNPGAAGAYLDVAGLAAVLGNHQEAAGVLQGAQTKVGIVRLLAGVVERHGENYLDPYAGFEVLPSLPPLVATFRLSCRSAAPTPERPLRVAVTVDGVAVAWGELTGMGTTLALEAPIPTQPTSTRVELRWSGAVAVLPAPTDDPLAVRFRGLELRLA